MCKELVITHVIIIVTIIAGVHIQQKGPVSKTQHYHLLSKTTFVHRKGILLLCHLLVSLILKIDSELASGKIPSNWHFEHLEQKSIPGYIFAI